MGPDYRGFMRGLTTLTPPLIRGGATVEEEIKVFKGWS